MTKNGYPISVLLGSTSPRRRQLIGTLGCSLRVTDPIADEPEPNFNESPSSYCERMALIKFESIKHLLYPSECLVTADTVVSLGDQIFGKPKTPLEAEFMLKSLRNKTHTVSTALVVSSFFKNKIQRTVNVTNVTMRNYSDLEIDDYINSGDYKDKAGAYSIQNKSFNLSRSFDGCYTSVVGLPLCDLSGMLIKEGFNLTTISCNKGLDGPNKLWI